VQVHFSLNQSCSLLRNAHPGQTLFRQGDDCDHVFELYSGIVRGVTISEEGQRKVVGFFFAGDQIGLPLSRSYRFSAEAVTEASYVRQAEESWRLALFDSCSSDRNMLRLISAEQDAFYRRGELMSCRNVLSQTAAFLLSIIDRLAGQGNRVDFRLSQIDIADYLAISPETVCRSLRRLREMHAIEMPTHSILVVQDREMLETIAQDGLAAG